MRLFLSALALCICITGFTQKPEVFGRDIISTGMYETHPAFAPSGDTVYFLRCMPDMSVCTIYFSIKKNNSWSTPQVVSFSGQYQDVDPFVTKDGNTFYFASNRPIKKGDAIKEDWDVWKVNKIKGEWGEPVHLDSPINSTASEYFPTIADSGNLYFGSSRDGGKGGADIYVSKLVDGKYSSAENIGDSINTKANEYEPYISPDESFMILMATPDRITNADFYVSYNHNGKWTKAVKLDVVNSSTTDWGGKMSRDGKYFYFGSTRTNIDANIPSLPQQENAEQFNKRLNEFGNGLGDIYMIKTTDLQLENE
jgi:Tol biopolymer transport system component